ncbi:MAG: glutamyl-tRNA amidotransferase [Syntrophobacteraceae bacterium CG07_land_8_20_14_0_80_61_8]|nr:MAG: glutamyl-tRNA amidotransferase [Syntrophobacteraceae bacterium CG07_land_8_20_14_0_80_61_8]
MELQHQIEAALKAAMLNRNDTRRDAIRLILAAIKSKAKELRRELTDAEVSQVIAGGIKQRRESVEQYRQGGRADLAGAEQQEIDILQEFLPQPLGPDRLEQLVAQAIAETGAQSLKDLGRVMKQLMPKVAGRADGKELNQIVRRQLA